MIFVGDVAIAEGDRFDFIGFRRSEFQAPWCLNLEGAISASKTSLPSWGVVNSGDWAKSFSQFELGPIFLGNNHIHDLRDGIILSRKTLREQGLSTFGAGVKGEAATSIVAPTSDEEGATSLVLLGFGWPVIGCKAAGKIVQA